MKVYDGFDDQRIRPASRCVAIGVFDGVHRGHRKILSQLLRDARKLRARSMVVTFEPHPKKVLKPKAALPILISLSHRLRLFEQLGIEEVLVIRFTKRFSTVRRDYFLRRLLLDRLGMKSLSVGADFCFGFRGQGDAKYLRHESKRLGFHLSLEKPLKFNRAIISSTRIRRMIELGRLQEANRMLGRPVSVYGTVIRGRGRGRSIGFPTANLNPHHETLPPSGVYAALGFLVKKRLEGVIHIGKRPTFGDHEKSLEVHFFNFNQDLYGREIELAFISKLRSTQKFKTSEALAQEIRKDAKKAAAILRVFS